MLRTVLMQSLRTTLMHLQESHRMSLSLVHSRALLGLEARPVCVEVHLANGLPSFTLVGLADTEVKEARERVRSAIQNAGLEFPGNKRITVNLAPADLPKDSGRFDLPIALGILAASGQIDGRKLAGYEFAGELSLGGDLRPVRGSLAMSLAIARPARGAAQALPRLVLPEGSAQEAALVPQAEVYRALHLLDVVRQFLPGDAVPEVADGWTRVASSAPSRPPAYADLADVKGQATARRALEIAAAGGHSILRLYLKDLTRNPHATAPRDSQAKGLQLPSIFNARTAEGRFLQETGQHGRKLCTEEGPQP